MKCIVCKAQLEKLQPIISLNKSVASDCRPLDNDTSIYQCSNCGHYQKKPNSEYNQGVKKIYDSYQPYAIKDGLEQLNFSAAVPFTRCQRILQHCEEHIPETDGIHYLDLGTGSGAMLQAIDALYPNWDKYAQDISSRKAKELIYQHQLKGFFHPDIKDAKPNFDVITAIHVLEHISDPDTFLASFRAKLKQSGIAIIQVPDINDNYWDFAIYDHISHFSRSCLKRLLTKHFKTVIFPEQQISKELTVVVSNSEILTTDNHETLVTNKEHTPHTIFNNKLSILNVQPESYILGTGPAACFCAHLLDNKFLGWLDEDNQKIDKYLLNKKVYNATKTINHPVFLPYPLAQISNIKARLPHNNYIY